MVQHFVKKRPAYRFGSGSTRFRECFMGFDGSLDGYREFQTDYAVIKNPEHWRENN